MKRYVLFDHDGVLVDTEFWYFKAGERALAEAGFTLDEERYRRDMTRSQGTWAQARAAGLDERIIDGCRAVRDELYREYLRTEAIEIEGVEEALAELSEHVRMAIVTTSKRSDFELIHEDRGIAGFMEFVLCREDYESPKPHPQPYLEGMRRFGASKEETLIVEDSARGLASAVAAGVDCAVVYNRFTSGHDLSRATHRITALSELKGLIDPREVRPVAFGDD